MGRGKEKEGRKRKKKNKQPREEKEVSNDETKNAQEGVVLRSLTAYRRWW